MFEINLVSKMLKRCLRSCLVLGIIALTPASCQRSAAQRSPEGSLLCPIDEDFYSYKKSASYAPARWGEVSECCEGQRQSPRNLLSSSRSLCGQSTQSSFRYNSTNVIPGKLYNDGHYPTIAFQKADTAYVSNSPYSNDPYILDNIHLHYCMDSSKGSEHSIDGKHYQGEVHFVHYKASYRSLAQAVLHSDGLIVLGVMLQSPCNAIVPQHVPRQSVNTEMVKIIKRMGDLPGVGKEHQLPIQINVAKIMPTSKVFCTYHGSMTSPPCSEAVRWIIMNEPINISSQSMQILRRLPNDKGGLIGHNCSERSLQTGNSIVETNMACASS